ncbi:MAG: polymer-forming cytoskeletal protein [Lachnospiraceae bacterium]|nr:polymer-forming cytoskeletal protein [Lachnospiraceae bacterium]
MSAGDAMETEDTDDEFLSKLSEALGTTVQEDAAPEPEPVYESAAEEVPAFESVPEEPVMPEAPAEVYAASEPEPAPVFESAPAMPQFTAPETTQTTFAQQGGYAMEMDMVTAPATDENAVITAGMIVHGDVQTSGNLELMGKVTGNVRANGKLTISGEITGDSVAAEIYAENARVNGEVKSQGSVKIGQSTVIIGNIHANGAVIAGAVKGDIDVHGPVILDTTAIVMGNIKSQSVQINNGAVIEGMCSQVYAEVNPSAFFDNLKG